MRRIFVHIGGEKTGSTSVQAALALNRGRLEKAGVFYPRSPGEQNHVALALYSSSHPRSLNLRRSVGLGTEAKYQAFLASFQGTFHGELQRHPCPTVVLSNEHLSSRLLTAREVGRFADLVRAAGTVKIIAYLRPQHELVTSAYSTAVTSGSLEPLCVPNGDANPYYNYERMLSPWADAFGEENMIVRVYDRDAFPRGDVVRDFFSALGMRIPDGFQFPEHRNTTLDEKALQFLRIFNEHVPHFAGDELNPDRADIMDALQALSRGAATQLPESEARRLMGIFEKSNASVARRFLHRPDGVLFPGLRMSQPNQHAALTVSDAVFLAAELWCRNQRQLARYRAELSERR